ncbi:molybdopterin-guanine dinucleotide biosynthesis protein A [Sediminihabitans luteus]|uniref:Molybdopterin-guanine dinucleotide biosynthesis protein A n=1 Tax=Sediminihabitans luteus TaxID=1138585 RepID=A0A2M9D061_9CELL|nr:NTP transferase domain-containing protein [Sediminihabitans luteus]PJJ77549.1 molybdopterin-guanine dinucleotide biosynthesis protein A [Sediminihabitans luteus]GII98449.1 hypothetical protein Slu03_08270 [Sediminihabitans luteus]
MPARPTDRTLSDRTLPGSPLAHGARAHDVIGLDARANDVIGLGARAHAAIMLDAIVLAGGRSSRLDGAPKPEIVVAGSTLLDHVLAATASAAGVVVVGPDDLRRPGVRVVREDPPFGGPVAAIGAGLAALDAPAPWVLVLACDVPRAARAVPALIAAVAGTGAGTDARADADARSDAGSDTETESEAEADGAYLVRDGRAQWLVGLYRRSALDARLASLARPTGALDGLPVRRLVDGLRCVEVPDDAGLSVDLDTWDDVARYEAQHDEAQPSDVRPGRKHPDRQHAEGKRSDDMHDGDAGQDGTHHDDAGTP